MVNPKTTAFHALHRDGCFVLPNPWDVGSALYLAHLGFQALATTSGGLAFSHGLADSSDRVPLDLVLRHLDELAHAVSIPVHADFQNGYAVEPDGVFTNVSRCVNTGVAGLSIEDASGDAKAPLYELVLATRRVEAARAAIDATGSKTLLTARCESFLVGHAQPFRTAVDRLVEYAAAGADCLFAPGVHDDEEIATIVRAVAPKAVNIIVTAPRPGLSFERLADLGVRRISVGSALARVAWGGFIRAAEKLAQGSFEGLEGAWPYHDINGFFERASQGGE